jgi:sorbitol/mannitol transport system substrate-binding protein
MKWTLVATIGVIAMAVAGPSLADTTLTIATVNNGDMIRMQKLTDDFKKRNPGIDLDWVTLEENVLREKVTTDVATKAGQYDVLTIGTYEVPIWAKQGWLAPLSLGANYDIDDLLPPIRSALSYDGKLYAAPFYDPQGCIGEAGADDRDGDHANGGNKGPLHGVLPTA